ncbi:hypothetical protein Tco_0608515 [Tanacetum coccineum]
MLTRHTTLLLMERNLQNQKEATYKEAKGLAVLSEVVLTESEKLKLAPKKQDTISQFSRKWLSEDEDEHDENDSDDISDEGDDDNNGNDDGDDDANDVDKQKGNDLNDDDEETNSDRIDSSVSSDFTSKILNLENLSLADNEITSLMETVARHATTVPENTSGFTTTIPPPLPFFNPLQQEATPTPTLTTLETTTSLPALPDFAFVFKFNERVFNLEKYVSEIKQVDQYAQALSSIPAIVDHYMDNKLGEAINKAILAHNSDCRQEAQDEKNAYI